MNSALKSDANQMPGLGDEIEQAEANVDGNFFDNVMVGSQIGSPARSRRGGFPGSPDMRSIASRSRAGGSFINDAFSQ